MKKYIVILFLLATGFSYAQSSSVEYRFKITGKNKTIPKAQTDSTIKVLKHRLTNAGYKIASVVYNKIKKEFTIQSATVIDKEFINDWLLRPCKVIFYECYTAAELHQALFSIKNKKEIEEKKERFISLVNISNTNAAGDNTSYIGKVKLSDTTGLNETIAALRPYLPGDCFLGYQQKFVYSEDPYLELYSMKNNAFKMDVNSLLDSAKMDFDYRGHAIIITYFNEKGKMDFAKITDKNIAKAIAITVDGSVYSAPVVNSKIEGGKGQIAGNYTVAEAKQMVAMLSGGYLPLRLTFIK